MPWDQRSCQKKEARPADAPRGACTSSRSAQANPGEDGICWSVVARRAMSRPAGQFGDEMDSCTRDEIWARRQVARMLRRVRRWIARGEVPW
jgi:hypothetical protein